MGILLGGGEQGRWVESLRGKGPERARFRFGLGKKYGLGRFGKWALCPEAQKATSVHYLKKEGEMPACREA